MSSEINNKTNKICFAKLDHMKHLCASQIFIKGQIEFYKFLSFKFWACYWTSSDIWYKQFPNSNTVLLDIFNCNFNSLFAYDLINKMKNTVKYFILLK